MLYYLPKGTDLKVNTVTQVKVPRKLFSDFTYFREGDLIVETELVRGFKATAQDFQILYSKLREGESVVLIGLQSGELDECGIYLMSGNILTLEEELTNLKENFKLRAPLIHTCTMSVASESNYKLSAYIEDDSVLLYPMEKGIGINNFILEMKQLSESSLVSVGSKHVSTDFKARD